MFTILIVLYYLQHQPIFFDRKEQEHIYYI